MVAAMIRGMAEEEPTARARQVVARKRVFYVVAAFLFIAGVVAATWAVLSGNGAGIFIFGFSMVPSGCSLSFCLSGWGDTSTTSTAVANDLPGVSRPS